VRRDRARTTKGARHADARAPTPAETAWLLLVPALAASLSLVVLLGPPLGRLAFAGTHYTYWPGRIVDLLPKPTELARFALTVVCALAFAATIPFVAARSPRLPASLVRGAVMVVQLLLVAALAVFWFEQRNVNPYDIGDPTYFTSVELDAACVFAVLAALALSRPSTFGRLRAFRVGRGTQVVCGAVAILVTVLWLLPSIFTDANIVFAPLEVAIHLQLSFDEAMSVLDGRSPLVDMATYGALVPYLVALPLAALDASLAAFTILMVVLTALALLAIYAALRRLTRHPPAALALYVPFVATSLFILRGEAVQRFDFGNYFSMFPIRYAGPYALAWLVTRHLDGAGPRSEVSLFAAAGLVVLNNIDFGLPALAATLAALVCARPPRSRRETLRLAGRFAAGLTFAFALVSALTLLRAGTLPHLGRLFAYVRLFGVAGFGNLHTPLLGFHLVILATFVAALTTASVRVARRDPDRQLTGMLAWCGVFGLGTGAYFAYRSHPDTLVASFSIWALTLAVLLIAAWRTAATRPAVAPSIPVLLLLIGFGIASSSLTQFPLPWKQVERIARTSPVRLLEWGKAVVFVRTQTRPGEAVAILNPLGHRVAYEAGVTNVMGYTGMVQMPTVEQLQETVQALQAAGGRTVILGEVIPTEAQRVLIDSGFRLVATDGSSGFIALRHDP
jgi:hypothetical protein